MWSWITPQMLIWMCLTLLMGSQSLRAEAEPPLTSEELTDRSGRRFTQAEILHMGLTRFEKSWDGRSIDAIQLYETIAKADNARRIRKLPSLKRRKIMRLDAAMSDINWGVGAICYDIIGGGTAVRADCIRLLATHEECLRWLLTQWPVSRQRNASGRVHFKHAINAFHLRIRENRRRFFPLAGPHKVKIAYPNKITKDLDIVEIKIEKLNRLMRHYPDSTTGSVGLRMQRVLKTLDKWSQSLSKNQAYNNGPTRQFSRRLWSLRSHRRGLYGTKWLIWY